MVVVCTRSSFGYIVSAYSVTIEVEAAGNSYHQQLPARPQAGPMFIKHEMIAIKIEQSQQAEQNKTSSFYTDRY